MVNNSVKEQENFNNSFFDSETIKVDANPQLIIFSEGITPNTHADLKPGGMVNLVGQCSMGYRTKWKGKAGYMTAGHCVYAVGLTVNTGESKVVQFFNNQSFDYAFIETNSSWTPTNNLQYTKTNYTKLAVDQYAFVVSGAAIAKSGMTTKYTEGTVKGINATVYYDNEGYTIKGLVKTNVYSKGGDSGAPVFVPQTDAKGGCIAIGILSGGKPGVIGIGDLMYFTEMYDFPGELTVRY